MRDDYADNRRRRRRRGGRKHSGWGIASFAVGIAACLVEFSVVVAGHVIETTNPNFVVNSPLGVFLALCVGLAIVLAFAGMGLGVAGMYQKRRKNIFAVLGMILSGLVLACVLFWTMVGVLTG